VENLLPLDPPQLLLDLLLDPPLLLLLPQAERPQVLLPHWLLLPVSLPSLLPLLPTTYKRSLQQYGFTL
jgi:hypothetical protein